MSGGSSSTGLANVASGTSDIGDSDVPAKNAKSFYPSTIQDHQVAIVVFSVAVNQAAGGYQPHQVTGQGHVQRQDRQLEGGRGANLPVTLYLRKPGSGTRLSFDKVIMKGIPESDSPAGVLDSTQQLLTQLAAAPGGVSYSAASSIEAGAGVAAVSIGGNPATADAVKNGAYSFYSHEHMYTKASGGSPLVLA